MELHLLSSSNRESQQRFMSKDPFVRDQERGHSVLRQPGQWSQRLVCHEVLNFTLVPYRSLATGRLRGSHAWTRCPVLVGVCLHVCDMKDEGGRA